MKCKTKNISMFLVQAITFLMLASIIFANGCAGIRSDSGQVATNSDEPKAILSMDIVDTESATEIIIQGNQPMTYTSVKQPLPMAVIIYLPNTSVDDFPVPGITENDMVDAISVSEASADDSVARVEISLKKDVPYNIETDNHSLVVSFSKNYGTMPDLTADDAEIIGFLAEENATTEEDLVIVSEQSQSVLREPEERLKTDDKAIIEDDISNDHDIQEVPERVEKEKPEKATMSSIDVSSEGEDIRVAVLADASIDQFKAFTLKKTSESPARIVVDMFGLQSPFEGEKVITVNLSGAERVRHRGYKEKVRLVIDTDDEFLTSFKTLPVESGLDILVQSPFYKKDALVTSVPVVSANEEDLTEKNVKSTEALVTQDVAMMQSPASEEILPAVSVSQGPQTTETKSEKLLTSSIALVNRVEFISLQEGKSAVILGTTRQIQYEIQEVGDKKILLRLYNTRLPEHHKRPLITTRFESAVNRVLPIQTSSMEDTLVSIEVRQMVAYDVDQEDKALKILFEASSIPPKPLERAGLPSWRQVMSETLEMENLPVSIPVAEDERRPQVHEDEVLTEEDVDRLSVPGKKYTGEKIALDFFETDIKNVFRILREVSGKNFAIDRDVTGTVTLTLEKPVPWDQVLDLILKMNQLGKIEEDEVIRIARMTTITQEEDARKAQMAARAQARQQEIELEPLYTEYISVNYSDARSDILPHLTNIATKERGKLSVDNRTNMIIMTDTAEKIRQAREIVQRLDLVTPQVIIEARIVEATSSFSKEIGIQWSADGGIGNDDPRAGVGPQRGYDFFGGTWGYDTAVNLPASATAGTIGFQFSRIFGTPLIIDAKLGAMESLGEGKIVSAPKVMTLNNKKAIIKQGREVPYSVVSQDGVNTQFKDVDLLLEVIPHVTPDDRVSLRVKITKDEIAEFSVDGVPSLSTKQAETELLINDGETIVIGGILQTTEQKTVRKVPGLGDIPVLNWLFKANIDSSRKEELLIFLTPRIMRLEQKTL